MYGSICQQGSQLIDVFQTARINLYVSPTSKACSCILFRLYLRAAQWGKMFIVHFGDMREELRNYVSKPVANWQQNLTVTSK